MLRDQTWNLEHARNVPHHSFELSLSPGKPSESLASILLKLPFGNIFVFESAAGVII